MMERRQTSRGMIAYQAIVLILLACLLIVGLFYFLALQNGQAIMNNDIQQIRVDYVKLREYLRSQEDQDKEISNIKSDLSEIQKALQPPKKKKKHQ